MYRNLIKMLVFAAGLFGAFCIPFAAKAAGVECVNNQEVIQEPNVFRWELDCPPIPEAGYHNFEFGDGAFFDVYLNTDGDSPQFTHGYAYGAGLTLYQAGLNYDNFGGLDYTFPVTIDVRPPFYVGVNPIQNSSTQWDWEYQIRDTGVYTAFVNTNCNGLAGNHQGIFQWQLDGPEEGNMFGNYVEAYFIETGLVTTTLTISDSTNTVVWTQDILAPKCRVPKPVIQVQAGSYRYMDLVNVTVMAPEGANSMLITAGGMPFSDYPSECQPQPMSAPVTGLSCTPGTRNVSFRINKQDVQTVTVFSRSWFSPYPVESNESVVVSVDTESPATCTMTSQKIDPVTYRFDYSWDGASPDADYHSLYSGQSMIDPKFITITSAISGTGSFTFTYPYEPGKVYTSTLFIVAETTGRNCEVAVVMDEELPEPTCKLEARHLEGDPFNRFQFKLEWANAYQLMQGSKVSHYLNFGQGDPYRIETINGSIDYGVVTHDYSWDTNTGKAAYAPNITITSPAGDVQCGVMLQVVDPNFKPNQPKDYVFLPLAVVNN